MSKDKTAIISKSEIFLEMDKLDQQQIVLAATGEIVDELVYQVKGQWGLSWAGINHIAFWMGDIKTEQWVHWEQITMFGDRVYWSATVRAVNEKYNLASLGTAEAPELMEIYDKDENGNRIPDGKGGFRKHLEFDPFCRRKALSMSQRNAKRAVTPEAVLKKWLQYFVDTKKGKEIEVPFSPKTVDAKFEVIEKPKEKSKPKKKKKPKPIEENQEDRIKNTLTSNGLGIEGLSIFKYGDKVRIVPDQEFPQDQFEKYNAIMTKLLMATWDNENKRWEI